MAAPVPIAQAPLADRANSEPAILRGLTASEASLAGLVAFPAWMLVGVVVGAVTRIWALAMLIASLAPMLTVWVLAGKLALLKRGRPDGFHLQRMKLWLVDSGLARGVLIRHHGNWSLGRALEVPHARFCRRKPAKRFRGFVQ